jgi:signal transduction histidine kinase/ActR/RegA family two-component response regulator
MLDETETKPLEEKIRLLEEENRYLAERAEEILLISMVSSTINQRENKETLFTDIFERISILKDIPLCGCFRFSNSCLQPISYYASFTHSPLSFQFFLSEEIIAECEDSPVIFDYDGADPAHVSFTLTRGEFTPNTVLLMPLRSQCISGVYFVFLDDQSNRERFTSMLMLLQQVVDIVANQIDKLHFQFELQQFNKTLDKKVEERTLELEAANQKLIQEMELRQKIEEELRHAQKMEAVGQLAGGISHDFNNLLTGILGYADLLHRRFDKDTFESNAIKEIKNAADRAASLTRQLLTFSRKQIVDPQNVNINNLILHVKNMLQRVIGENIEFETRLGADIGIIKSDPVQVEQIIMNLSVNARDAMPDGGKLLIQTQNIQLNSSQEAIRSSTQSTHCVLLTVTDTGHGIPQDHLQSIFEPFFTTKEKSKGTGLGLSTVYGIVKQSQGHIAVRSQVNKGTTFSIYFPIVDSDPDSHVDSVDTQTTPFTIPGAILVVEDNTIVRELTVKILQNYGYLTLSAAGGYEALPLYQEHKHEIALVITDMIMPKMNGQILAKELHKISPSLKIIFMSGYSESNLEAELLDRQRHRFIQKPFNSNDLQQAIMDLFGTHTRHSLH